MPGGVLRDGVTLDGAGRNVGGWSPRLQAIPTTGAVGEEVFIRSGVGASWHPESFGGNQLRAIYSLRNPVVYG